MDKMADADESGYPQHRRIRMPDDVAREMGLGRLEEDVGKGRDWGGRGQARLLAISLSLRLELKNGIGSPMERMGCTIGIEVRR
ncbi:hypothetical protein DQX05_11950 [Paenibacillus thiaminolyticus]|uniref:Uncharacterized protein n=1 Tax=Paenibacillus thiaminolyticus TaxID=49283 RepID=A0A3A3GK93_PANTH|nr:hypothetical protein DQX05_11950 [Paenibacillus thiaminolyticus]